MHVDVVELQAFYESPLGTTTRQLVLQRIRRLWPDLAGLRLLGYGYPTPYLRPYLAEAERVLAFMPAGQGVIRWPGDGRNLTGLTEATDFPLPDSSIDRVLIVHGLEAGDNVRPLLREIWRILAPGGRVLIVAPNRRSLWAQAETTPFGTGRPYTRLQLERLLRDQMFTPLQWDTALHVWPMRRKWVLRWSSALERFGARWLPGFGGVHLAEASKQIYGISQAQGATARTWRRAAQVLNDPAREILLKSPPNRDEAAPGGNLYSIQRTLPPLI